MKNIALLTILVSGLLLSGCTLSGTPDLVLDETILSSGTPSVVTPGGSESSGVKLDLSGDQLKKIPDDVFKRTNLEELDLSNNEISGAIQAEIRFLQKLRVLNLSRNIMTGVPAEVGQLANLEILDLSDNQLTGLPYELGNLQKLKILDISGNNYSAADLKLIMDRLPAETKIIK